MDPLHAKADQLSLEYAGQSAQAILEVAMRYEFKDSLALVSSFGAESAVLLHQAAQIDPDLDVVFVDTGKLFGETKRYRDRLTDALGLTNVKTVAPVEPSLSTHDPRGILWSKNINLCCYIRRVEPLERALTGYEAWISGRKRFQSTTRSALPTFEAVDGRIKVNPLAGWQRSQIESYFEKHNLPRHPLEADGYRSIGCMPCTDRVDEGEDARAGRWRGVEKIECGIHLGVEAARRAAFGA